MFSVLLGAGLIYGIRYEFKPSSRFTPPLMAPLASTRLLVLAYDGNNHSDANSSFVQASVTIIGPQSPLIVPAYVGDDSTIIETFVNETFNGTTTTDPQSPLIFTVPPGEYSLVATYGSTEPQTETLNVTPGGFRDVFLNFGSVPLPPLGHIFVTAWCAGGGSINNITQTSLLVQASITIRGPESHNGTTTIDYYDPLIFTVAPGEYTVVGTYGSWPPQTETVDVTAASGSAAVFIFGDEPWRPPT